MEKNNRLRNLKIIFIILLAAIVLVLWFDNRRKNTVVGYPLDRIGMDINGWHGTNMPVSRTEQEWVDQGDMIMRSYKKGEDVVYLVAIQERGDRHRVHSPADCYTGLGWVVLKKDIVESVNNSGKKVKRMHVIKNNQPRILYYWFTNGRERCAGFKMHLLLFLRDVIFKGAIKSWVCFQISTDVKNSIEETEYILKDLLSTLDNGRI